MSPQIAVYESKSPFMKVDGFLSKIHEIVQSTQELYYMYRTETMAQRILKDVFGCKLIFFLSLILTNKYCVESCQIWQAVKQ